MNDGQIQNPSNPLGIVPLSNFVPRGFGFVHHSIAILCHEVPNPNLTIRNFFIAVRHRRLQAARSSRPGKQSSAERPCPCRSSPTRWTGGGAVSSSGWTCCWTTWATRTSSKSTWVSHSHPLKCGGTTPCAAAESAGCTQLVPVTSSPQDGAALFASCLPRQHASLARNPKMRLRTS